MNKMIKRILAVILVTSMLLGSNGISYAAEVAAGDGTAGAEEVSLEPEAGEQMESPGDSEEPAWEESAPEEPAVEEPAVEEPKVEGSSTEAALPEEGAAEEFDEETNAVAGEQIDATDVVAEPAKAEAPMGANEPDEGTAPLLREENVSHSANLADFLTDVEIDAPLNDDGTAYKVEPGIPYAIGLKFKEKPNLQFDNDVLTYNIPTGLNADGHSGSISVTVQRGDQEYTISNNTFSVENGVLTLTWNQSDPNFHQLTAAANIDFGITLSGVFTEETTHIQFSDEISKDVEFERTNEVRTYKKASVDIVDDRVYYTATVESFGISQNVVVTDTITGTGLTLDPNSISFESSTGQPVSATGTANGNSFTYTIPRMANQEVITITYSAIIDPSQLQMVNGRVVTQSHNKIKATSEGDPQGHESEVNTEVSYTPSIYKGVATELVDQQDGTVKKLQWTVFVNGDQYGNNPPKVSAAGTVVTDTINETDRDIMKYSGTGITVRVTDAQGRFVRTDTIPYGQLDAYSDYSWQYTIPQSDAGNAYRYEITYTTDVETADLTLWRQLGNVVVTNGGQSDWGSGEVVPEGGIIDINKTVTKIDKKNMEVSWETIVDVPKNGLPRAIMYDVYPTVTSADGETLVERIKPDTVEISGLQSGEAYTINYDATYGGKAAMTITFTKNGQPGLIGTGQERQVIITYKTIIDSTWLKEAETDDGKIAHLNSVWLQYDGWVGDEETAYIRPYTVDKNAVPVATRTVDGVELPVYRYEVTLTGIDYDDLTITDKFDTEILELYDDGEGANYMYGGERLDNLYAQGFEQVAHQDITGGVQFTLTAGSRQLRRTADGGYFTYYKLVYYLTVKDAAALEKLGMRAVADGGETELTNEASWEEQTDTSTVAYAYNGLDKELLNEEDLHVDGGDIYAEFRITLNPAAQKLNGGEPLTMTDTVSNLSVDITSIKAEPSADVTWDMSGNTVTYTIPDQTKVVITYRARVLFTSSGALVTTFSNHAEMEGYYDDVDGSAERQNSGSGSGSVPSINLMKYEAGNMTKRLAGAKFQLLFGNKQPVLDKNGNPVIFTTDANGMITVEGDQEEDGWTIIEDTRYYLREIEAPPHYMLASFDYSFQVSSDGTTDYSQYIYHSGDTMSAKNYPGTDVQVEKVWTDGYGNHESDTVTVKLQQKIGDEDWSDTIREEVKQSDGSYVWVDTAAKVLTLDNNNDWKGTFASLPLEVPNPLPVSDESVDVAVEYRVIETKVNDIDVTPDESDPTAGTYNGGTVTIEKTSDTSYIYTITNTASNGSLKIEKLVTENGASVSSDAAKSKLAGEYTFTVYTDEDCTTPLQKGGVDVTVTITIPDDGSSVTSEEITDIPAGTYYVKETSPTTSNPSPVENPVTVTVEAGKTGEATVIATITNDYKHVDAAPEVNKSINVWPESITSFDFTLTAGTNDAGVPTPMPASGGETASATNTTSPAIFGMITFEVPGTYNYTIKEVVPEDDDPTTEGIQKDGITYTDIEYPVQIVVEADSTTGQLKTPVIKYGAALDQNNLTVTNDYAAEGKGKLEATKAVEGAEWPEGATATFTVTAADGTPMPETTEVVLTAAGTADFGEIKYTLEDAGKTYTYTITETGEGFGSGWSANPTEITATVVVGADKGDGTLEDAVVTYSPEDATITNSYAAEGEAALQATKAIEGADWPEGAKATFTVTATEGTPMPETTEVVLTEAGTADFGKVKYALKDAGKTYTYTITETPSGFNTGWTSSRTITATVVVGADKGDGTLEDAVVTYDPEDATITNKYEAEGKGELEATKAVKGAAWPEGATATFTVTAADGTPMPETTEVVLTAAGKADFGEIKYMLEDAGKTYIYTITETGEGFGSGWSANPAEITATVVVGADKGDGTLEDAVVTYDPEDATITNTYTAKGEVILEGLKILKGRPLEKGRFAFELYDSESKLIEQVESDNDGTITFAAIEYTQDNMDTEENGNLKDTVKTYTMKEVKKDEAGYIYSETVHTINVTLHDDKAGNIEATADKDKFEVTFTNEYKAEGEIRIPAKKVFLSENKLQEGMFSFELKDADGNVIDTKTNDADGNVLFDVIKYTQDDVYEVDEKGVYSGAGTKTYTYTVNEVIPEGATDNGDGTFFYQGYTYDGSVYTIAVVLTDNGDGTITAVIGGETGAEEDAAVETDTVFTNAYDAAGTLKLDAEKIFKNGTLKGGEFTFELMDADGKVQQSKTNDAAGNVSFDMIAYKLSDVADSPITYTVHEVPGNRTDVKFDATIYTVTVELKDNGDGTLEVTKKFDKGDELKFVNEQLNVETSVTIGGEKVLKGRKLKDGEFKFLLADADGKWVSTATNDAEGYFTFKPITYKLSDLKGEKAKIYTYGISEIKGSDSGIIYDRKVWTVKVTVTDNGDGTMTAKADKSRRDIRFVNTPNNKTGDEAPLGVLFGGLGFGTVGLVVLLEDRRRRNRKA